MTWRPRPWYWGLWLLGIVVSFAVPEALALHNGGLTFSAFMDNTTSAWPLWEFCWGLLIGGLAVHILVALGRPARRRRKQGELYR